MFSHIDINPSIIRNLTLPFRLLPRPSQHPEPNRSLAMFRDTHMGPFFAKHILLGNPEIFSHAATAEAKMWHSIGSGLIGLCFRGSLCLRRLRR